MDKLHHQFFLFAAIGAIGTGAHYITLIGLVELLAIDPLLATSCGFVVGALINYVLNYRFTFRSRKRHVEALSRFLVIAAVGAVLNLLLMYVCVDIFGLYYLLAQVAVTAVVLVWNFAGNKLWSFREH